MSQVSRYLDPAIVEQLRHLQLTARSVVEGSTTGQHKSPVKGASVEFRQHRFYVPGDEPRRIDWRVFGRTDRPYVKEYDEETNLRCMLLLDCSGSMKYGRSSNTKFDYASRLAAALAFLMLGQTESVGLALFSQRVSRWIKPSAASHQLSRLLESLERSVPQGDSGLAVAMHEVAERLDRRSLVIAVSDFFSPSAQFREGLSHLRHRRHEVIVIQVTDRDEEEFPFHTWHRFKGLEGEKPYLVEPALVRERYLDNFRQHRQAVRDACTSLRAEYASFVSDEPLAQRLRQFLEKRAGV